MPGLSNRRPISHLQGLKESLGRQDLQDEQYNLTEEAIEIKGRQDLLDKLEEPEHLVCLGIAAYLAPLDPLDHLEGQENKGYKVCKFIQPFEWPTHSSLPCSHELSNGAMCSFLS